MEGGPGVGEEGEEDFSFDGLPGAQHEFKVEVPGNQEECFVQKVAQNAELHASFEVGVIDLKNDARCKRLYAITKSQ